jgi:hypothetical protein
MNVYRVEIEQWAGPRGDEYKHESSRRSVRARTAQEAIRRVLAEARKNGYLKTRPIEVTHVERIATDVL